MKNTATLKRMAQRGFGVAALPIYGAYRLLARLGDPDETFWTFSQALSLVPGKTGSFLRNAFYRLAMTACHPDVTIQFGTLFSQRDTEIGPSVYIGPQCNIGRCRMEAYCTLGSGVHIMSGKRQHFFGDPQTPIKDQGGVFEKVVIGEDTWIGNGALVMASVGKKCVVGAGAVVAVPVPDYAIMAGNPAKQISQRKADI
jgi:acetyltransferase-like isoleucine patch superfamily enzyme